MDEKLKLLDQAIDRENARRDECEVNDQRFERLFELASAQAEEIQKREDLDPLVAGYFAFAIAYTITTLLNWLT